MKSEIDSEDNSEAEDEQILAEPLLNENEDVGLQTIVIEDIPELQVGLILF